MKYFVPEAGGVFEHRGLDCECHGDCVVFAKPYHSAERYRCVACLLEEQAVTSALEKRLEKVGAVDATQSPALAGTLLGEG